MSQILNVSLDFTSLLEKAKQSHSSFKRAKNGKAYVALSVFVNDEEDDYGNDCSVMLNSTKEMKKAEGNVYVGNGRISGKAKSKRSKHSNGIPADDGLPF